ncbi:MAG: hypothetical protein A2046_10135 [Bacteroidetes bacterium GWA2_30_7]|nr:MAG: hypothetical protein A2046_10135 [Bacteroidetes bacterium GWA2_30_7]
MKQMFIIQYLIVIATITIMSSCKKDFMDDSLSMKTKIQNPVINNQKSAYVQGATSFLLYAGQTTVVGIVEISVTNDNLLITYNMSNGNLLDDASLFIGESLSLMPQTPNGAPKIGLFPYKSGSLNGVSSFTFTIPLSVLGGEPYICDKTFYIVAHASVRILNLDGSFSSNGAWAGTDRITQQGSWATYFTFVFACQEDIIAEKTCETAFAFGQNTFIDFDLTDSRWGWVYTISDTGFYETPLYAGAGRNDISKGTLVGTLEMNFDGTTLTVSYNMLSGFEMDETQLFASSSLPTTIAPGQFGNMHDLFEASSDEYILQVSGDNIYIIAHAEVCSYNF